MDEQTRLNKQIWKNMYYNMIAFAIIFILFGLLAFILVSRIIFYSVDKELKDAAKVYIETEESVQPLREGLKIFDRQFVNDFEQTIDSFKDSMLSKKINDPKILALVRDEDGNILNSEDLSRRYSSIIEKIPFIKSDLNKVYQITVDEKYIYRAINVETSTSSSSETRYVQLLINIDSEMDLIGNYAKIIVIIVVSGIFMSIVASYILSRKTLAPVEEILKKQMEFVENASHELRTPLTIIQAKQELLLQEPNARIIDKSEDILLTLNEAKRLSKLTKDLMILARADDNRITLDKDKIDIDKMIDGLVKPYIEAAEIEEKELKLDLQFKEEVNIDRSKMYQVMVILLDNAIKYTETGDSIEVKTYLSKDNRCMIEVRDTGIGISDDAIEHIFERFYREDKSRTRSTGGSGLGLSIADAIVKAHGGTIKASHNEPKGTVFTIRLNK